MNDQRLDHLSRRLARFRTRRQALKTIAGAVVATVAGTSRSAEAQSCTAHYSPCQADDQCCAGAVCQYGLCMPGCRIDGEFFNAWTSAAGNICQVCAPELSTDDWSPANEGMNCWSGDPNAGVTICQNGACAPVAASCPPPTACHLAGEIDPTTGMCVNPPAPAGTPCGNEAMCYGGFYQPADTCDGNGFCIGGGSRTIDCAPYTCAEGACATSCSTDGDCTNGTICCAGSCVQLNTIDHCGGCGDTCAPVDACTPAACDDGICNEASICTPVDACTPARCLDTGTCNQVSTCTGFNTCGGGGTAGQCGCTPSICQQTCDEPNGCGGTCAGQAATTPAISVTFASTGNPSYCAPTAHLSGFTGCTAYTAEYRLAMSNTGLNEATIMTTPLTRTDVAGASDTGLASYVKTNGYYFSVRIGGVSSSWQRIAC